MCCFHDCVQCLLNLCAFKTMKNCLGSPLLPLPYGETKTQEEQGETITQTPLIAIKEVQ